MEPEWWARHFLGQLGFEVSHNKTSDGEVREGMGRRGKAPREGVWHGAARGGTWGCTRPEDRAQELKLNLRTACVGVCDGFGFGFCSCVCLVWFGEEREESGL